MSEIISEKYSVEISKIMNRLKALEKGYYYEKTRVKMDGSLANNIYKVKTDFIELISKIDNESESTQDRIFEEIKKLEE